LNHGVLAAVASYHWPGNVRELQNVMAALAGAAPARGHVRPSLLPAAIANGAAVASPRLVDARAARDIGISRQGLIKLMARLGIATG
jgi:transcriptional regulator of acetoin/glycerol metabolism